MIRITKKILQNLAYDIMIKLENNELINLSKEFNVILKQMDLIKKIDTINISAMHFPFDSTVDYLREDDDVFICPQTEILTAAPKKTSNYIEINKVVK